jgi:uncharacterized membrane protein
MKYTSSIEINLNRDKLLDLFDNTENLYKWQPDLKNFQHLSGEPGQKGAKSKLVYKMGKRDIEMIETITERKFPEIFIGTYIAKGVKNKVVNIFQEHGDSKTIWTTENEFKFSGFMAIMSKFMNGAFKKQTEKTMNQFKEYAESQNIN